MALRGGCFEVTELSVAACSVAACHACKNVCEVKNPESCGLVPKKGLRSLSACNDRATHRLHSATVCVCVTVYREVTQFLPLSSKQASFCSFIKH